MTVASNIFFIFTDTVPAGLRNWQYWKPTGVTDHAGPRRTESCGSDQNASATPGRPPDVHKHFLIFNPCIPVYKEAGLKGFCTLTHSPYDRRARHPRPAALCLW